MSIRIFGLVLIPPCTTHASAPAPPQLSCDCETRSLNLAQSRGSAAPFDRAQRSPQSRTAGPAVL
eukprot:2825311-Rhodomonas_salina.3